MLGQFFYHMFMWKNEDKNLTFKHSGTEKLVDYDIKLPISRKLTSYKLIVYRT